MKEHYTDGRRWSYISNAWIFESGWNDKEEIARLQHEIQQLRATPAATDGFVRVPREVVEWIVNDGDGREVYPDDLSGDPCPAFKALQQSLLAAAPQSGKKEDGWISVKERLPELTGRDDSHVPGGAPATLYSESVLVFDGTVRIDNLIQAEGDPETTTFYVGTCEPITHWMPLPSPPSKAEGE